MDGHRRSQFGSTLRQYREAAGLSQEQLAERAGLSLRGISDIERGLRTTPRLETVRLLADGLSLTETERSDLLAARNSFRDTPGSHVAYGLPSLPVPPNAFIGRLQEVETITNILQGKETRLLTLAGPGGVGKTRIAIEVAHRLTASYRDGAIFVDLAPVRKPEMVMATIADRLGIQQQANQPVGDVLAVALQSRLLLMVLDNVEHVVSSAPDIASLLASCPDLTILATSRVLLRVAAEYVLPIDPMDLPTEEDAGALEQVESIALFVARARAFDPEFALHAENIDGVSGIVARLQGMPLAIELAAARTRMLPVIDLLNRLDTQLPVLTGGGRDSPDRHRTMRDTIAWSYDLLSPKEQATFRTLAIFPDGCTLETAVVVLKFSNEFSESETLDAVGSLLDSSVLRQRPAADGQVRLRMLQTVREYGLEQLAASGEDVVARRAAHTAWCVPLVGRVQFVMCLPDEVFWLNRASAEYQNLREHLTWLVEHDLIEDALDVSGSLATFRVLRWHLEEGRQELQMLFEHPGSQKPTYARMRGCIGLGILCNHLGDIVRGLEYARAGVELARGFGEQRHLALALTVSCISLFLMGQLDEAETLYGELMSVATANNDSFFIASTLHGLASIADNRGQLEQSGELLQQSLALCEAAGHMWGMALCKHNLGYQCIRRGEFDEAERFVLEAQQIYAELEGRGDSSGLYLTLASIAHSRGDEKEEMSLLEQALVLAHENGSLRDIADGLVSMAQNHVSRGDLVISQALTFEAIDSFEQFGSLVEAVRCMTTLADIALAAGDAARAGWCIGAVDGALVQHGMWRTQIETDEHQSRIDSLNSLPGHVKWQKHYDRGYSMSPRDILAEVRTWRWSLPTVVENPEVPEQE